MADVRVDVIVSVNRDAAASINRARFEIDRLGRSILNLQRGQVPVRQTGQAFNQVAASAARARITVSGFFQTINRQSQLSVANLNNLAGGFRRAARFSRVAQAAIVGGGVTAALLSQADASNQLQARIRAVADSSEDVTRIQRRLLAVSQETRTGIQENARVFGRLRIATRRLGTSEEELIRIISGLNRAVLLSGATTQEANAGLIQLAQGLASGRFQGDELRSVLENLVVVGDQLSQSLGVTIGGLRELGEQGRLTPELLVPALLELEEALRERFNQLPVTLGQSVTRIRNVLVTTFTGDETQPLVDSLAELSQALRDPQIQAGIRAIATGLASAAGFAVDAFRGLIQTFANIRNFITLLGFELGALIDRFKTLEALFTVDFARFFEENERISRERASAIAAFFQDQADAAEATDQEILQSALGSAQQRINLEERVTENTKQQAAERKRAITREIRDIEREIAKNVDLIEELREEVTELVDPTTTTRSIDPFIAQTERLSDVRRVDTLIQEGQFERARELASALFEEGQGLEDVIQRTFIVNNAKRQLIAADLALAEQTTQRVEALQAEKAELEAIRDLSQEEVEARRAAAEAANEQAAALERQRQEFAQLPDAVQGGIEAFRSLNDVIVEVGEIPVDTKLDSITISAGNATEAVAELTRVFDEFNRRAAETPTFGEGGTVSVDRRRRGGPVGFATGGRIPGFGGGDRVPILAERGEFVVNKRSTRANLSLLRSINNGLRLPRMQAGGVVPQPQLQDVTRSSGDGGAGRAPVIINLPSGQSLRLQEGQDSVETIKRVMNREALKRGRRVAS